VAVPLDLFKRGDVYIDFPYEDALFHYESVSGRIFRRFYGEPESEIARDSKLFHEAISAGEVTTAEHYAQGMPREP
jgi:hypothetical protein